MKLEEQWIRWQPTEKIFGPYYLDRFCFLDKKLIIRLFNLPETNKVEIVFDCRVNAYRYTNESFCFTIFGDLSEKYGSAFFANWSFFKVINSDYTRFISQQIFGNETALHASTHFVLMGDDEIIDILSDSEPKVRIITDLKHDK